MTILPRTRRARLITGVVAVAAIGVVATAALDPAPRPARAPDLAQGAAVYAAQCAACHGAELEGAPNWRQPGPDGRLPAPPHDADGHTWHHADDVLIAITTHGTAAVVGGDYESDMPGFDDVLSAAEIEDVIAFIKSTWPERQRAHQAAVTAQAEAAR
jgi:mono/diheme cytochrome c family protein